MMVRRFWRNGLQSREGARERTGGTVAGGRLALFVEPVGDQLAERFQGGLGLGAFGGDIDG